MSETLNFPVIITIHYFMNEWSGIFSVTQKWDENKIKGPFPFCYAL